MDFENQLTGDLHFRKLMHPGLGLPGMQVSDCLRFWKAAHPRPDVSTKVVRIYEIPDFPDIKTLGNAVDRNSAFPKIRNSTQ